MTYVRSFDDFVPPKRYDAVPFIAVDIEEAIAVDGPYSQIDTQLLSPIDTDPSEPLSRSVTTDAAQSDPGWYVLVWRDNGGAVYRSDPVFSGDASPETASFINRSDLADYLHRPEIVDDDAALMAVDAACATCRDFAGQLFNLVTDEEIVLDGTGTDALLLPQLPVLDVTAVTVGETALEADDYKLNGHGVLLRPGATWPRLRQNVTVTYSHGYTTNAMPREIRMVALTLAARLFTQGPAVFEVLGAYQVRYAGPPMDLTNGERAILRKYRR